MELLNSMEVIFLVKITQVTDYKVELLPSVDLMRIVCM